MLVFDFFGKPIEIKPKPRAGCFSVGRQLDDP
jgi:hypothetical protein